MKDLINKWDNRAKHYRKLETETTNVIRAEVLIAKDEVYELCMVELENKLRENKAKKP